MLERHEHGGLTWIDLETPGNDEVRSLMDEYGIHPVVAGELLSPTIRSRVDIYDTYIYLIFHFPTVFHSHNEKKEQEIDFIVGKDFVITTHYGVVDVLHEFSKLFEVDSILDKERIGKHGGFMFFYMIRHLYSSSAEELGRINASLAEIEARIFNGQEHEMVREISNASRQLLNFKKAIEPHRGMLESFEKAGGNLFGESFSYYLHAIFEEYYKISIELENYIETLAELRVTNDSLLNTKTNDIMRTLTILAFVTFPLSLVAGIFGMNTETLPVVGSENDFWVIVGTMVFVTAVFFGYFKYKKWL